MIRRSGRFASSMLAATASPPPPAPPPAGSDSWSPVPGAPRFATVLSSAGPTLAPTVDRIRLVWLPSSAAATRQTSVIKTTAASGRRHPIEPSCPSPIASPRCVCRHSGAALRRGESAMAAAGAAGFPQGRSRGSISELGAALRDRPDLAWVDRTRVTAAHAPDAPEAEADEPADDDTAERRRHTRHRKQDDGDPPARTRA